MQGRGPLYPEVENGSITLRGWGVLTHIFSLMWILWNLISRMLPWLFSVAVQWLVPLSDDNPQQAMAAALTQSLTANIDIPYLLGEDNAMEICGHKLPTIIPTSRRTFLCLLDALVVSQSYRIDHCMRA